MKKVICEITKIEKIKRCCGEITLKIEFNKTGCSSNTKNAVALSRVINSFHCGRATLTQKD